MKWSFWHLILILFWAPQLSWAITVPSLYKVDVPVASQSTEDKQKALKVAFKEMLFKLSGDADADKSQLIQTGMQNPQNYIDEFSYSKSDEHNYLLSVQFNKDEINKLLKRAGIPFWGENRPLILVWLTVTDRSHANEIMGDENTDTIISAIKQESVQMGLPIIFPMMDMVDMTQISPTDINTLTMEKIHQASERYNPEALLIGHVQQNNNDFQSEWQLNLGDNQWRWSLTEDSVEKLYSNILNQVSQTLAKNYLIKSADIKPSWLNLEISNVSERNDLSQLMKYLKQLSQVQEVQLSKISGEHVDLAVLIAGDMNSFRKNAIIGQRMVLKNQDTANNKLLFQWVR